MKLYLGNREIPLRRQKPSWKHGASPYWDSFLLFIDDKPIEAFTDLVRGRNYYFQYESKWYSFHEDDMDYTDPYLYRTYFFTTPLPEQVELRGFGEV